MTTKKFKNEYLAYSLCCTRGPVNLAAMGPKDCKRNDHLPKNQNVDEWSPIRLELSNPTFEDYMANNTGFRLFSECFRDFIEQHKQPKDSFQWLENPVFCGDEERPYFILHFYDADDVLEESRIIWHPTNNPPTILKPVFSARKIQGHSIFTYVNPGYRHNSDRAYVTRELKQAILKAKMTGVTFEATAVTDDL